MSNLDIELEDLDLDTPLIEILRQKTTAEKKRKAEAKASTSRSKRGRPSKQAKARQEQNVGDETSEDESEEDTREWARGKRQTAQDQDIREKTNPAWVSSIATRPDQIIGMLGSLRDEMRAGSNAQRALTEATGLTRLRLETVRKTLTSQTFATSPLYPGLSTITPSDHVPVQHETVQNKQTQEKAVDKKKKKLSSLTSYRATYLWYMYNVYFYMPNDYILIIFIFYDVFVEFVDTRKRYIFFLMSLIEIVKTSTRGPD